MIPPTTSASPLSGVRLALVPISGLEALAALRGREDVTVGVEGERAWVAWTPAGDGVQDEMVQALLPVPGVSFFRREGEHWYRVGKRLPEFDSGPTIGRVGGEGEGETPRMPLRRAILPEPIRWLEPRRDWRPATLRMVAETRPRPASAMLVRAIELLPWADSAPTAMLTGLRAARSGDRVLLVGRRLPPIAGAGRYWGRRVLVPLGFRAEPELPEARMIEALGLAGEDLGLIAPDGGVEVVPGSALEPLSRSAARLMAGISGRLPREVAETETGGGQGR